MRHTGGVTLELHLTKYVTAAAFCALLMLAPTASAAHATEGASVSTSIHALRSPGGTLIQTISPFTPITGSKAVTPIIGRKLVGGTEWLRVRLSGRPNGRSGLIPAASAEVVPLPWRIRVDLSNRTLVAFHNGRMVKRISIVVGAPDTPTPTGHFFVVEKVRLGATWSHTGWALALSAFSNVLKHFDGGQGQVAIHARGRLLGALGSASSHGCMRARDGDAGWLAHRVPNGTPVDIVQ